MGSVRMAMPLRVVERVVRAVAPVPVPGGPACLLGMIDVGGTARPLFRLRELLGIESKPLEPGDRIVLTGGARGRAFLVDEVVGVLHVDDIEAADSFAVESAGVRGIARREDGMILVRDFSRFLSFDMAIPLATHA